MSYYRPLLLAFICVFAPFWTKAQIPPAFSVIPSSQHAANACQAGTSTDPSATGNPGNMSCAPTPAVKNLPIHIVPFRDPKQKPALPPLQGVNTPGFAGAHLNYYGGPVISNVEVVVVYWGNNVSSVVTDGILDFYQTTVDSTYLDLLYEYSTAGVGAPNTNQKIGHGTVLGPYTIVPSITATNINDGQIQAELQRQIQAGVLPPVTTDENNQANTLYTVYFPPGMKITDGGSQSCVGGGFCAYHGSSRTSDPKQQIFQYSVVPDFGSGSGCDVGCGGGTEFQNVTSVSSHELAESITDAQVGFATVVGPPLAWYDTTYGEIGDICNGQEDTLHAHGKTFTIQQLWSNNQAACVNGPDASLSLSTASGSVPAGTDLSLTVTVNNSKGVTLPFYTGTVHFTSTDPSAQLPPDYTFSAYDGGTHTFNVSFNTTGPQSVNAADVDVSSIKGSVNETVTQTQQTPVITWAAPQPITYGTPLGPAQLNATASVPGTFVYTPNAGTVLSAGSHQLGTVFTPSDTTKYKTATAFVQLQVNQATPAITWATPAPITYGTALSTAQLNASANTPGTFVYSPPAGTVLPAGAQTLKVTFTPNDTTDYGTAGSSVTLQVYQLPAITSANSATFTAGTAGSFAVTATGYPTPTLGESGALPNGLTFNPANGLLSGMPAPGTGGIYKIGFTASSAAGNIQQAFTLVVSDFTMSASPGALTIPAGHIATYSVSLTPLNGFNGTAALSCTGGPPNSTCTLSPTSVSLSGSGGATMTVALHPPMDVNLGTFNLTVTAQSGGDVHTATVSLTVK